MTTAESATLTRPSSITPILDRVVSVPPPAQSDGKARAAGAVLGALIGLGIVFGFVMAGSGFLPGLTVPLSHAFVGLHPMSFLAVLILCFYLGIAIHEMGHLIFGLCAGLRFNFISFGPLLINRDLKASLRWKQRTGASGLTSMVPNGGPRLRGRLLFMILGGPLANVVSAVAALSYKPDSGVLAPVLTVFAVISALMGLGNLVPFRSASTISDGRRIWSLLFNNPRGARWLALIQLGQALIDGTQPDHLDKEVLRACVAFTDNSPDTVAAHALAYSAAYLEHRDDDAGRFLETCLAYCRFASPRGREGLFISASVFQALRRSRIDLATQWLQAVPARTQTPGLRLQAEAAILEAQGDIDQALFRLGESKAATVTIADPSLRAVSLASLERWEKELSEKALAVL